MKTINPPNQPKISSRQQTQQKNPFSLGARVRLRKQTWPLIWISSSHIVSCKIALAAATKYRRSYLRRRGHSVAETGMQIAAPTTGNTLTAAINLRFCKQRRERESKKKRWNGKTHRIVKVKDKTRKSLGTCVKSRQCKHSEYYMRMQRSTEMKNPSAR